MRKVSKVLFIMTLITILTIACCTTIKAADELDYSGYEELGGDLNAPSNNSIRQSSNSDQNTTTTKTTEPKEEPKTNNAATQQNNNSSTTTNKSNTATQPHIQAGSSENVVVVTMGMVAFVVLGIGYVKFKKFNY